MTILTSEAPAATPTANLVPRWADARDQMIHACALQEHIIANAPVLPTDVKVHVRNALVCGYENTGDETDVEVYLHQDPAGVAAYQKLLGGELHKALRSGGTKLYTELVGHMAGCRFSVWALTDVVEQVPTAEQAVA